MTDKPKKPRAKKKASEQKKETAALVIPPNVAKLGRPSIYSTELAQRICDMVANRVSVWKICAMDDMPSEDTLYRWKRTIPEFSELYARARRHRADARQDRIDFIAEQCGEGAIDPMTARLMIDAEKWQMAKEQPKAYGDKIEVEGSVRHEHISEMSDDELSRIARSGSTGATAPKGGANRANRIH